MIRSGGGPVFLEMRTYRFRAHSMFDPELYRSKEEVESWKERGPIRRFSRELFARGLLDDAALEEIQREVDGEIAEAVQYAEVGTWEPVEDLMRYVYSEKSGT
jgi:TPP-dependent pyruvate/acetoin dehydrogenase alpha subunit